MALKFRFGYTHLVQKTKKNLYNQTFMKFYVLTIELHKYEICKINLGNQRHIVLNLKTYRGKTKTNKNSKNNTNFC